MGADVDDECVSGYFFGGEVVIAPEQEDDLGLGFCPPELDAQLESVDFTLAAVEDVVSVPSVLCIDELVAVCHLLCGREDGGSVVAGECVMPDNEKRQLCSFQFLASSVFSCSNFRQDRCAVAQMGVSIGEIGRSANVEHSCPLLVHRLQDPGVEDWRLCPGIDSNQEDDICVFDALDL